jgi:hypothetical protein
MPQIESAAAAAKPNDNGGCSWTPQNVGIHLAARGIVYTGPCGSGVSGAKQGIVLGTGLAGNIPVAGPAIQGFGAILAAIFQHHAKAVAKEQAAVCTAVEAANTYIPQIDAAVASGSIGAADGVAQMERLVASIQQQILAPVSGPGKAGQPCNAGCCYQAILDAHVAFARLYYPAIASGHAVGAPGNFSSAGSLVGGSTAGSPTVMQSAGLSAVNSQVVVLLAVIFIVLWASRLRRGKR